MVLSANVTTFYLPEGSITHAVDSCPARGLHVVDSFALTQPDGSCPRGGFNPALYLHKHEADNSDVGILFSHRRPF